MEQSNFEGLRAGCEVGGGSWVGPGVHLRTGSFIWGSFLEHVQVGEGCLLVGCHLRGQPEQLIRLGRGVELIQCQLEVRDPSRHFAFAGWKAGAVPLEVGEGVYLEQSRLEDAVLGAGTRGQRCSVVASEVGASCHLRPGANLILTHTADRCNLGSEISKSVLAGAGFVSEHGSSYLSLVAPAEVPILNEEGKEELLEGMPNLTNIGAGTVFANYGGRPKPARELTDSSGSEKGTALVYSTFTAVNSVIVNRYGQPPPESSPFDLLRRRDLTVLGFSSFVEGKATGRIPAFSYASQTKAQEIRLGWVLQYKPGILLNLLKKTRQALGDEAGRMRQLVEGVLRLELRLLQEEEGLSLLLDRQQRREGARILQENLDGRWRMNDEGELLTPWHFDPSSNRWFPAL